MIREYFKILLSALAAIVIFGATIHFAFALNETELQQINSTVYNITNPQMNAILAKLSDFNVTNQLSQAQIDNISSSFASIVSAQVKTQCNPYLNNDSTIADPLQKALSGAISNSMDTKFIDQRQWLENTYIPKQNQFDELEGERDELAYDLKSCRNDFAAASAVANASYNTCIEKQMRLQDETQSWQYMTMALAVLLFLIMGMHYGWFRNMFKRN